MDDGRGWGPTSESELESESAPERDTDGEWDGKVGGETQGNAGPWIFPFDAADTRGGESEDRPLVGCGDGPTLVRAAARSGGRAGM